MMQIFQFSPLNFMWKFYFFFIVIQINIAVSSAQNCKISTGNSGYCRAKDDCFGESEDKDCQNGFSCCINSGKATEKCKEYGKYVYKESYGEALMARRKLYNVSECNIEAVPLIVGGLKAKPKEFPHMVAIGYGDTINSCKWMCGGSLISEKFVLTAAHCSESREKGPAKFVRMGALNIKTPDLSTLQEFSIVKRINHPKYSSPSRYYDIALFKLSRSVQLNGDIRPACLQVAPNEFSIRKVVATGWGKLGYEEIEGTAELMKVAVSIINYSACNSSFSPDVGGNSLKYGISPTQLCAGELSGGKDTCQGDSGGPIQIAIDDPYCMYSIIGVTSFGKFCGFKNSPAVYTRVSYFIPWIESIVWP